FARLAEWARSGVRQEMYDGGLDGRAAQIEEGAGRHIGDIRLDLTDSAERLLGAFADFPDEGLFRQVQLSSGAEVLGAQLPLIRIREVEIHHVDLDTGYQPGHWEHAFVARTLDELAPGFLDRGGCPVGELRATDSAGSWRLSTEGRQLRGPQSGLLAWL